MRTKDLFGLNEALRIELQEQLDWLSAYFGSRLWQRCRVRNKFS